MGIREYARLNFHGLVETVYSGPCNLRLQSGLKVAVSARQINSAFGEDIFSDHTAEDLISAVCPEDHDVEDRPRFGRPYGPPWWAPASGCWGQSATDNKSVFQSSGAITVNRRWAPKDNRLCVLVVKVGTPLADGDAVLCPGSHFIALFQGYQDLADLNFCWRWEVSSIRKYSSQMVVVPIQWAPENDSRVLGSIQERSCCKPDRTARVCWWLKCCLSIPAALYNFAATNWIF